MPYYRINKTSKHPLHSSAIIPTAILVDKQISLEAKGVFACIFSYPENFYIDINFLTSSSTDDSISIISAINELVEHGYISEIHLKDSGPDNIRI